MRDNQSQVANTTAEELKQLIVTHMEELGKSFDSYFPEKDIQQYPAWVQQPLSFDIIRANVKDP